MFNIILFWLCSDRPSGLFFRAYFTSFHTHASLLTFLECLFVLFQFCCSHARVFWKTIVHRFPISYIHTECYIFSRGRVDDSSFFEYLSSFFLVNWISLYFFHIFWNTNKSCLLLLYFDYDSLGLRNFFLSLSLCFFPYSRLFSYLNSSVSLSNFIIAVPMLKCLGKHSCMSYTFPIAILNGTFFFDSATTSAHFVFGAKK